MRPTGVLFPDLDPFPGPNLCSCLIFVAPVVAARAQGQAPACLFGDSSGSVAFALRFLLNPVLVSFAAN